MSPEHAREWVSKAEADRRAAQRALGDARRRRDQAEIACFHAQQCAEKYLKPGASASVRDARTAFSAMERVARLCREFLG